jgi:hypothetical protein
MTGKDRARIEELAARIERFLAEAPRYFVEVVALTPEGQYRDVLKAWGLVRDRRQLERDEVGRYLLTAGGVAAGGRS